MRRRARVLMLLTAMLPANAARPVLAQTPNSHVALEGIRNFAPLSYQADRQNWTIAEDDRGILFFANSNGVLEFDGIRWRRIPMPGEHGSYAVGKSADGRILVGGEGEFGGLVPDARGALVFESKAADFPEAFRSASDRVIQILDTPAGQVVLSDHWLFVRTAGGTLTAIQSGDHFTQAAWFHGALHVLDSGRGLTRLENGALKDVPGGSRFRGVTMLVTGTGLLIPSYNVGLIRYTPDSSQPWQILNPSGWTPADSYDVTSAVALSQDLLAFGTAKHGVTLIDAAGQIVLRVDTADGLIDSHVYGIHYDHRGGLWVASGNGLSLVSLALPNDPTALPFRSWVRSVIGTRDDRLLFVGTYFATPGGIQQLPQGPAQKLTFPYTYNAFRFAYSANGLQATGAMEFQTYMRGVDKDWSSWSTRSEREFTQLAPGTWVFQVRARKPDGEVSSIGTYELKITPAWYDTWWFAVFQFFFVVGLMLLPGQTQSKGLQNVLTTFAVIVPFTYISGSLSDFIKHYSSGVGFFKILMSSLLALLLDPGKKRVKKFIEQRNAKKLPKQ